MYYNYDKSSLRRPEIIDNAALFGGMAICALGTAAVTASHRNRIGNLRDAAVEEQSYHQATLVP